MNTVLEKNRVDGRPANGAFAKRGAAPKSARWTVDEYYRMYDAGLFQGKRVQLIRGEIIEMAPMGTPHSTAVRLIVDVLRELFGDGHVVDSQLPLRLGKFDEPEPDVAVVEGSIRDFASHHPTTAVLVIEVSDTSIRFDRKTKADLYAEYEIPEYWIVNLKDRVVEVHRSPAVDRKGEWSYSDKFIVAETEKLAPIARPRSKVRVADILP